MTRDDGYTRYTVRIPTPLYERVKEAAGEKSVNAEIVAVLEEKYPLNLPAKALLDMAADTLELLENTPGTTEMEILYAKRVLDNAQKLYHTARLMV